jgi:RNA polymerase sigma-70 factor (ECF subfamily)
MTSRPERSGVEHERTEAEQRFRTLFDQSFRPLLAYALRRVQQPADASDVVAETFVVAWRRIDEVPVGDDARFWLFGVARRLLSNQQRGELRRSNLAGRLHHQLHAQVVADQMGPADTRHVVEKAMSRLDLDDQELLRLASWEGLSAAEIAVAFAVPPATARTRLHRARGRFRAQIEALGWNESTGGLDRSDAIDEPMLAKNMEKKR